MLRLTPLFFLAAASAEPAIIWTKVSEPMTTITWSYVEDIDLIDAECRSDNTLPRVCLYRHKWRCRIITNKKPEELSLKTREELIRMCGGWFPEPVLLHREFSSPNYLPNQAPPSVDPAWQYQNNPSRVKDYYDGSKPK
jgi:hypothetical protein